MAQDQGELKPTCIPLQSAALIKPKAGCSDTTPVNLKAHGGGQQQPTSRRLRSEAPPGCRPGRLPPLPLVSPPRGRALPAAKLRSRSAEGPRKAAQPPGGSPGAPMGARRGGAGRGRARRQSGPRAAPGRPRPRGTEGSCGRTSGRGGRRGGRPRSLLPPAPHSPPVPLPGPLPAAGPAVRRLPRPHSPPTLSCRLAPPARARMPRTRTDAGGAQARAPPAVTALTSRRRPGPESAP